MRVRHEGKIVSIDTGQLYALPSEQRVELSANWVFLDDNDQPLTGGALKRLRNRISGNFVALPPLESGLHQFTMEERWLITDLWPEDTFPMLDGPPKVGKTTVVVDMVATLMNSEHKFLGRFGLSPEFIYEDWLRGVVLINAENPVAGLVAGLREAIGDSDGRFTLVNLEERGGPQNFDLTDPELYEEWLMLLAPCFECEGFDDRVPYVVIVDGLTAILAAAGKGPEAYGLWYAAFRRLMRDLGVPNALVVAHSTLAGDHPAGGLESQAGPDGIWNYNRVGKTDKRIFSVKPRYGGVQSFDPITVEMSSDGHPVVAEPRTRPGSVEIGPRPKADALVLAYVTEFPGSSHNAVRAGIKASNPEVDAALLRLVSDGQLDKREEVGRGGKRFAYFPGL